MRSRIEVGEMEGFLAYEDDEVVGWMNAQPRHKLPHCFERMRIAADRPALPRLRGGGDRLLRRRPARRRSGVARTLLADGLAMLAARGTGLVDAFPFKSGASEASADHYHGPLSMFRAAGFSILREEQNMTVVRKLL